MGKVIMSGRVPKLSTPVVPAKGIALNTIAEGSIIKINENGAPVEFYVACHDYESALNGAGRTLLVRKDCHSMRQWHSSDDNSEYADCTLSTWFNGSYKELLDADVQEAIGTTTFYYTHIELDDWGDERFVVATLNRSVFALSATEFGYSNTYTNTEGSELPVAGENGPLDPAYYNGSKVKQWTRSPAIWSSTSICVKSENVGGWQTLSSTSEYGARPCFTLPSTALFDEETLLFKGVA